MVKVKRYWEHATEVEAECFGLECDEKGFYDWKVVYSEREQREIKSAQAWEAYIKTPEKVRYELGL